MPVHMHTPFFKVSHYKVVCCYIWHFWDSELRYPDHSSLLIQDFWEYSNSFGHLTFLLGVDFWFNAAFVHSRLFGVTAARSVTSRRVFRFKYAKCFNLILNPNVGYYPCAESVHILKFHLTFRPFPLGCAYQCIRSSEKVMGELSK